MAVPSQPMWRSYASALGITALALSLSYGYLDARTPFLPCAAAIILTSWLYGGEAGALATFLLASFTSYMLFVRNPPGNDGELWRNIARETLFIGVGAIAIAISMAERKAGVLARERSEWLSFTLANIANGVITTDRRGHITFLNAMARRLTGYGDDAIGMPCSDVFKIVALETKEELENPVAKALRESAPARFVESVILISRDGRRYVIEDSATSVSAPQGSPASAVLVFRDVTEQRRVEAELRSAAERFRLALEAGKLIPWEWNIASDELISDGLLTILPGVPLKTRSAYLELIHPGDRDVFASLSAMALESGKTCVAEYRLIKPGGEILWVETRGQPIFNERGEAVKMLGVLRDMTEQKLVETIVRDGQEQFRNVAESASDGFVTIDEKGKILYANSAFAGIFRYQRSELIGQPLVQLVPEALRERHMAGFERFTATGEKTLDWSRVEFPGLCKDGSETPVEMSYSETRAGARRLFSAIVRDISQRKRDQQAVEAAHERLELAQRIAGLGTFEWDLRTGRATVSPELARMFGFQPGTSEATYEMWEQLVHPDDLEMVRASKRAMLQEERPEYSSIYRVIWPDESVHWLESKTKVFRGPGGEPLWALGVNLDITHQKSAESEREKLLAREMAVRVRMELAHRIAGIGTFEWDARTGQSLFSPELERLYGLRSGEFRQTFEHWQHLVHPEDWPHVAENSRRAMQSNASDYSVEFRVIWPDQSVHWITTKGQIYRDEQGHVTRVVGVEQEFTDRKAAEAEREKLLASEKLARERLELAQRAAGIGIYERHIKTGIIHCWPELLRLMGLPPGKTTFQHDDWVALIHPDDRWNVLKGVVDAGRTRNDYYLEYRVDWPDGSQHWLASSGRVLNDAKGEPEFSIGATVDITEHKAIEAERERIIDREKAARAHAERASQLKDEFLATVSHELRTPLTAVIGWAKLLLEASPGEEQLRRGLESIERNGRAQARLVEDLLDISSIVTGRMRIQMQPLDLAEVVSAAVDGVRPAAQAKKIQVELKLRSVRVSGDADRLQQVAFNILFNAVKFCSLNGRVEVHVESDGYVAKLIVRDNGKGIGAAFLPSVFQRFSQEDASSTRRFGGMGLGLAIARHLVELHGGNVRAESPGEGQGATLTVELPVLRRGDSVAFENPTAQGKDSAML